MPGRLLDESDARIAKGPMAGVAKQEEPILGVAARLNGVDGQLPEGPPSERASDANAEQVANGIFQSQQNPTTQLSRDVFATAPKTPPEIAHITQNFHPLSRLIERTSQQCFNSLDELLTSLASLPEVPQVNGDAHPNGTATASGPTLERKLRWLNFANSNRERFLKLFVLLQWSRNVQDVSKLIDVFAWMRAQFELYGEAEYFMGLVARDMPRARIPNPDIDTALEVLSTGKAARMPDLHYIPLGPLSSRKILNTLRNLNVLLNIRLNLHEKLPAHFKTYTISSGRATFIVPTEFEVDLFIADEDPAAPFYFNDLRFLFFPRTEIPAGQIRLELERRVNEVLAADGLAGCYDFLHDFVLTHKINVLRRQAIEMSRSAWAGSIRIEQMHRALIVQYWTERPGSKSWIEIGVSSGNSAGGNDTWKQSSLAIRWTRSGKEVDTKDLLFNAGELDMETVLKSVIACHVSFVFQSIYDRFLQTAIGSASTSLAITTSKSNPGDCSISIPVNLGEEVRLQMEPIGGTFALSSLSSRSTRCEEILNSLKDPSVEAFARLQSWRASELAHVIESAAKRSGWNVARPELNQKSVEQHFGHNIIRISYFRPWSTPQNSWVVVSAIDSIRETWWVAKYADQADSSTNSFLRSEGSRVVFAKQLRPHVRDVQMTPSFLKKISRLAVSTISSEDITSQLKRIAVHCIVHGHANATPVQKTTSFVISLSALLRDTSDNAAHESSTTCPWATDKLALEHHGLESNRPSLDGVSLLPKVVFLAKGIINGPSEIHELLASTKMPDITFSRDGVFAILMRIPLGSTQVVDELIDRLRSLARLRKYVEVMKRHKFVCNVITMESLVFTYATVDIDSSGELQDLKCSLAFHHNNSVSISFSPANNPHHRLRTAFMNLLNRKQLSDSAQGANQPTRTFESLANSLPVTLYPLLSLDRLERQRKSSRTFVATVHSVGTYRITYRRPHCAFELSYGLHHDQGQWKIRVINVNPISTKDVKGPNAARSSQTSDVSNVKLKEALKSLFNEDGDGWFGLRTGIVIVEAQKTGHALRRLDQVVRDSVDAEEEEPEPEESAEEDELSAVPPQQPGNDGTEGGSAVPAAAPSDGPSQLKESSQNGSNGATATPSGGQAVQVQAQSQSQPQPGRPQVNGTSTSSGNRTANGTSNGNTKDHELIVLD